MTLTNPAYRGHQVGELPPVTHLPKLLSTDQLQPFRQLAQQVRQQPHVRGYQQRMGANNLANPSRYRTLKEYAWPAEHKAALHQYLPDLVAREATHWLLQFDKGDFLDEQDAWVDRRTPVDFLMVALYAGQQLVVDGETHTLQAGDAIQFNPAYRHEVPPTSSQAAWIGFMVFRYGQVEVSE